ncbi:MAG: shikimate dehydrogenase, partial [Opitutaceae bacterium]|nr:shikimate dehydrogenase [Opitutaceae bacterium]
RAIAAECLRLRVPSLWVANRTAATRDALLGALAGFAAEQGVPLLPFPGDKPPPDFPTGALVVNATSLGLRPGDPVPIDPGALPRPRAVLDIIYNPPETALLRRAAALGIPSANGLSMLVHQGAGALGIWTGAAVPVAAMRAALA